MDTKTIIKRYRDERGLTQAEFAKAMNEVPGAEFVRQNISQWEQGTVPNYWFMRTLYLEDIGWQSTMALEVLRVLKPELYGGEE